MKANADNLYSRILGLPNSDSDPDHYQLLGIERYTDSAEIIRAAATDQNRKLLAWQNNDEHHKSVAAMMREVAVAMRILLDPDQKREYDQALARRNRSRQRLAGRTVLIFTGCLSSIAAACLIFFVTSRIKDSSLNETLADELPNANRYQSANLNIMKPQAPSRNAAPISDQSDLNTSAPDIEPSSSTAAQSNDDVKLKTDSAAMSSAPPSPKLLVSPFDQSVGNASQAEWADAIERKVVETNTLGMKLILIPPGRFRRGRRTQITISRPYYIGKFEVTQSEWESVMGPTEWRVAATAKGPNFPAASIRWSEAEEFCEKLTMREQQTGRLPQDWTYALPTEVQWEFACRAGTSTRYSFGDDEALLGKYGWVAHNSENHPHEVGQKLPNAFGLHDMHGNTWEWCRNFFSKRRQNSREAVVAKESIAQVKRGGYFAGPVSYCGSGYRSLFATASSSTTLGFRVVAFDTKWQASQSESPASSIHPHIPLADLRTAGMEDLAEAAPIKYLDFEVDSISKDGSPSRRGNADGHFFIESPGGWQAWNKTPVNQGAIEVSGRIKSGDNAAWLINVQNMKIKRGVRVAVHADGRVIYGDSLFPPKHTPYIQDVSLTQLNSQSVASFHTIIVLIQDRSLRIYLDGAPIGIPQQIDFDLTPGVAALGAVKQGRVEFEYVAAWKSQSPPASTGQPAP